MPAPNLGYGTRGEAPIDAVNTYMRASDWYQALIRSFGQQPNNVRLTANQKQQVIRAAQAHGIVVDEGSNGQEVDESGNFRAKGHKLRNTLIVAGIAGAALATMGAAGVFSGAAAGGTAAGGGAAAAGTGAAGAGAGVATAAGGAGLGSALLRYGLPIAGNLVGGIIAAGAEGRASDAQQRYLEEALAYEKEKDQYARSREARLDTQEERRYGDYQGRIAPWIANGTSSNDRMASLLGLPARSGASSGGGRAEPVTRGAAGSVSASRGDIEPQLRAYFTGQGVSDEEVPGWVGYWNEWGHTDPEYFNKRLAQAEVFGRQASRTPSSPRTYAAAVQPAAATPTAGGPVQMRAPDGSVKRVPADQVAHYTQLGATLMGAGA